MIKTKLSFNYTCNDIKNRCFTFKDKFINSLELSEFGLSKLGLWCTLLIVLNYLL